MSAAHVSRPPAEGFARLLLALLVVATPILYAAKVGLTERTTLPQTPRATWSHTVVLTVGRWPTPDAMPKLPAFDELERRAVLIGPMFTAAAGKGPAAVSLWTGRFASNHGVLGPTQALPGTAWTLARAAADSGAVTAAFLQAPLVSRHAIGGFDVVEENPQLSVADLCARTRDFLNESADERRMLWVHLDKPGPGGEDAARVLDTLHETFDELEQRPDAMIVFTALEGAADAAADGRFRVPFAIELPAARNARRRSAAHLSQVDVAGALAQLLRLPLPNPGREQVPFQSRSESMLTALKGGGAFEWVWIDLNGGHVVRMPGLRVEADVPDNGGAPTYDMRELTSPTQGGAKLEAYPEASSDEGRQRYLDVRRQVFAEATKPVPSR